MDWSVVIARVVAKLWAVSWGGHESASADFDSSVGWLLHASSGWIEGSREA